MQHERKRGERSSLSCNPENKVNTPEDSFHYTTKLYNSTQWLLEAEEAAKRRFLTGILVQCQSQEVLHNVQKVLQVTMGKDFTYTRSRVKARDTVGHFKTSIPDVHLLGKEMLDTWKWFKNSTDVTKTNYLFGLLAFCDAEMLHMLGNLARMLIEKHNLHLLQCNTVLPSTEKDSSSVTESNDSFRTSHDLDLLARASSVYEFPHETRDNTKSDLLDTKGSGWSVVEEIDWNDVKDPALMVVPISSRHMSGICKQRDFIRALPVGLAKRILGLLDKDTLQKCKQVSQHWRYLTEETIAEQSVKKMVEEQAMILQGIPSVVNPAYARIRKVLVPFRLGEVFMQPKNSLKKSKDIRGFEAVYTKIKTKVVEMEERNVYCGVYNSLIMLDREDHSRVIHYDGGSKVALGTRDRSVRLLDMVLLKEVPPLMYGHAGSVRAVLVCEERELVISASYDLSIRCWNMKTGACMMLFSGHMGTITCLDLNRNYLVSGARDCKVKVWNLQTGQCCDRMRFCHRKPVVCVKTDLTLVLSGCEEGLIKMWDMETANLLKVTQSHQGSVRCLFLDQFHILSGGSDSKVLAWSTDRQFKKCLMTFQHPREVVTVSSLFLRVITGCVDGRIRIFNLLSGDCLRVIKIGTDESPIRSLHTHHNTIVVNSSSRVLFLQFSEQQWDYSAPSERIMDHTPPQPKIPAALPSSTKPKKNERRSRTLSLSQRMRNLSAPSMHHLHEKHYLAQRCVMTPSERAVRERLRKKSPHQSFTPTQVFLKVRPRRQPEFKGSPPSAQKASKRSHSASKPSSFEGTLKIYTPLKTDMHPSIPSPALFQTLPKSASTRPHTACTTTTTTTQEPRISFIKGESKHPSHHVDFELPARSRQIQSPLDPFRESGGFQLRTDTQLEEYKQAQMQANLYTLPKEGKKRQCRASWKLKVKVAPVKDP